MARIVSVVSRNCELLHRHIFCNQLKFVQLRVQEQKTKHSSELAGNKSPSETRFVCIPFKDGIVNSSHFYSSSLFMQNKVVIFFCQRNTQTIQIFSLQICIPSRQIFIYFTSKSVTWLPSLHLFCSELLFRKLILKFHSVERNIILSQTKGLSNTEIFSFRVLR
jgi:hypothetical protein